MPRPLWQLHECIYCSYSPGRYWWLPVLTSRPQQWTFPSCPVPGLGRRERDSRNYSPGFASHRWALWYLCMFTGVWWCNLSISKLVIRSLSGVDRCSLSWWSRRGLLEVYEGWTEAASAGDLEGKVNGIQDFLGQVTLESWPFGILGPTHFRASYNLDGRPHPGLKWNRVRNSSYFKQCTSYQ